jgi:hypothetical protein
MLTIWLDQKYNINDIRRDAEMLKRRFTYNPYAIVEYIYLIMLS